MALLGYLIWSGYRERIHSAETTTRNYAAIIEARLDATLRRADAELRDLARTIPVAALRKDAVSRYAHELEADLDARVFNFPELAGMRIADASGDVIYTSASANNPRVQLANRDYFRLLRDNPQADLVFSEVIISIADNRQRVIAARALRDTQGAFRGMVFAALELDYFQKLFQSLDIGAAGIIAIYRSDDFKRVMRWPVGDDKINAQLGLDSPTRKALAPGVDKATVEISSAADGIVRIYSYDVLDPYPFFVSVGVARKDALAEWKTRSLAIGLSGLLLVGLLAGLVYRLLRTEDSLKANEERMRSTFEQAAVGIAHIAADTFRIIVANETFCQLLGYTPAELVGTDSRALTPADELSERLAERAQILAGEIQTSFCERRLIKKGGNLLWVQRSLSLVRDSGGQPQYFISVIKDISERKEAEDKLAHLNSELETRVANRTAELEVANRELSSFSYSVAHDLRAPLRAINGFSAMVLQANEGKLDQTSIGHLQRIHAGSVRMGVLIDDLLRLTRLSRQDIRWHDINLSALAARVVTSLTKAHPERDLTVTIQPDMNINGDTGLMQIVIENLIGNAWKFTANAGAARIDVGCEQQDGQTVYYVRDNGAGFDMAYAHKLFAPFQRLHHVAEFEGTGIGLATVKSVIQRHGGKIWIEGAVNLGATVFFTVGKPP